MTRTAVRRHVDVTDGRLVIRKIVVETSDCREVGGSADVVVAVDEPQRGFRIRSLRPGKCTSRLRGMHLL